jgi:hypothetical protein
LATAGLIALLLAGLAQSKTVTTLILPWSRTLGAPRIRASKSAGLFIWHTGSTVTILTAGNTTATHVYNGTVFITEGELTGLTHTALGPQDKVSEPEAFAVAFNFVTGRQTKSVTFRLIRGTQLALTVTRDRLPVAKFYCGQQATPEGPEPVTFNLKQ